MHSKFFYKMFVISLVLAAQIFICGCGGTSEEKALTRQAGGLGSLDYGEIRGFVYKQDAKTPISAAIVEALDYQAVSASDGAYILGPMPEGSYRVFARSGGYTICVKDDVSVIKGQITQNINFSMSEQDALPASDFEIISLSPNSGKDGDEISIFCRGCGKIEGKVLFNGKEAQIVSWNSSNDDKIVVYAPSEVESGFVKVVINGKSSNERVDLFFYAMPVITGVSKSIASPTQVISVYGRNFNPVKEWNKITLKKRPCFVESVKSSSELQIRLPADAETGKLEISIETPQYQLDGVSNQSITIAPKIISISPKRAVAGVPLTIHGLNFGDTSSVVKLKLGSAELMANRFMSFSNTKIVINSPDGLILPAGNTAKLSVIVNGAESNAVNFTSYDPALVTLGRGNYGIYNLSSVSDNGTLRLSCLAPTDKIVFLSVLAGNATQSLDGDFSYVVSAYLGANTDRLGTSRYSSVPSAALRSGQSVTRSGLSVPRSGQLALRSGQSVTRSGRLALRSGQLAQQRALKAGAASLRASISEPAEDTLQLYFRNPYSSDYADPSKDIAATACLRASSVHALVYTASNDEFLTEIATSEAQLIGQQFDSVYSAVAAACSNDINVPPEGNIDLQGRIALVFTSILNSFSPDKANPLVCRIDERDKDTTAPHSAASEIIYVNSEYYTANKQDTYGCIAQSLASMIYKNQKGELASDFIDIGLGMLSRQDISQGFKQKNQRCLGYVSAYLAQPQLYSLNHTDIQPKKGQYGMSYLFMQYLFDRYGGRGMVKQLETPSASEGIADIANNVAVDMSFEELFVSFCKAVYFSGLGFSDDFAGYDSALYGFSDITTNGFTGGIKGPAPCVIGTEAPLEGALVSMKGYSFSLVEYPKGNWGDLEITFSETPTVGSFSTWVIYCSTERLASP